MLKWKKVLSMLFALLLMVSLCGCGASVTAGTGPDTNAEPIEIDEKYVGTWANVFANAQNVDPDTGEMIRTFTIKEDGTLCFNGKEIPVESTFVAASGASNYEYDKEKYLVYGEMDENVGQFALTLMIKGKGEGAWIRSESMEVEIPAKLVGVWNWVQPDNPNQNPRPCPDENGEDILSFTIDADGSLTINGKAYPLNVAETWLNSVNGSNASMDRFFWGEKDESNWAPYSLSKNEMYGTETDLQLVTSPWAFSVHNDYCEGVVISSSCYIRDAQ